MRVCLAALGVLFLAACASVPQLELTAYRDAFAQSRAAVEEVSLDFNQARDEFDKKRAASAPAAAPAFAAFPEKFVPPSPQALDHATVLGKAMEAIERYNALLLNLAEGKSVAQLQGSTQQFVAVLAGVTNIVPGVGALAVDVMGALEKARSQEEFRKAVLAGRPVIDRMLDLLIANAADYYDLRVALARMEMAALKGRMAGRVGVIEKRVALNAPGAATWTATARAVNAALDDAGGLAARKNGVQLDGKCVPAKAVPCASLNPMELNDSVLALQEDADKHQRVVEKMNTYFALIQNYVLLLQLNKQALADLAAAIDRPQSMVPQFKSLYATAMLIRKDLLKVRSV